MDEPFVVFDPDTKEFLRNDDRGVDCSNPWWTTDIRDAAVYASVADWLARETGSGQWPSRFVWLPVRLLNDAESIALLVEMHKAFVPDDDALAAPRGYLVDAEEG